jgi:hypothetical protein
LDESNSYTNPSIRPFRTLKDGKPLGEGEEGGIRVGFLKGEGENFHFRKKIGKIRKNNGQNKNVEIT